MPPYRNILFDFFPGESAGERERELGFRLTTTHLAVDAALHGREEDVVKVVVGVVRGSVAAVDLGGGGGGSGAQDGFETDETDERMPLLAVHHQFALQLTLTDCGAQTRLISGSRKRRRE